jgi:Protein of unknown function (DUF2939)
MRMFVRGAVALVILVAAYWGWALAGAAQLASAASRGDAQAVMERVDLQPLIRSLSSQIGRAYLDQNPQLQKLPSLRQGVFLNASAGEMLLRALLTPDNIAALLNQGRVGVLNAGGKDNGTVWGMPSLGEAFHARPLQVLMHSYSTVRWASSLAWKVPMGGIAPYESVRRHVAPVGCRHSRAGHGPAGEPHRAEDRRSGESPGRLTWTSAAGPSDLEIGRGLSPSWPGLSRTDGDAPGDMPFGL